LDIIIEFFQFYINLNVLIFLYEKKYGLSNIRLFVTACALLPACISHHLEVKFLKRGREPNMNKIIVIFIIILLFLTGSANKHPALYQEGGQTFSLDNAAGLESAMLSKAQKDLLRKNGFVVTPPRGNPDDLSDIYIQAKKQNQPLFITTDSMLHTAHIFFNYVLRILEIEKLYDAAVKLTDKMLELSRLQYEKAQPGPAREAARLNRGFFAVAKKIFDPGYETAPDVKALVEKELQNIDAHEGLKIRELLAYVENPSLMETPYAYEDYSQYIPRGHYTRNDKFKKYFKVMMWYGRMDFKLKPGETDAAERHGRHMTMQALLIADALMRNPEAMRLWRQVYEPTVFFAGQADDLHPPDYIEIIRTLYPEGGSVSKYDNSDRLDTFIQKAAQLRQPRILSGAAVAGKGDMPSVSQGFRFMGQRFIPDSAMFQQLVFHTKNGESILKYTGDSDPFTKEDIPGVGPARAFPRGLDVMAVLGSKRALQILEKEGDTNYTQYDSQMEKLRSEISTLDTEDWTRNLYWSWLYSLRPLLSAVSEDSLPAFMRTSAWQDKALMTALGSWTELRHDTILYAKQSYTMVGTAMPPPPQLTYGYVEPYPQVYSRLQYMMRDLREVIKAVELSAPAVSDKVREFEDVLSRLEKISQKQLHAEARTEEEYKLIWNMGQTLAGMAQFPPEIMEKITSEADKQMDVVADVHTDLNTSQVLEEGVGSPFDIYVIIGEGPDRRLCRGGVFSYYEFKWPLDDRLTDEAWQDMEASNTRPALPPWTSSFIAIRLEML
jgi:hypothetical protein